MNNLTVYGLPKSLKFRGRLDIIETDDGPVFLRVKRFWEFWDRLNVNATYPKGFEFKKIGKGKFVCELVDAKIASNHDAPNLNGSLFSLPDSIITVGQTVCPSPIIVIDNTEGGPVLVVLRTHQVKIRTREGYKAAQVGKNIVVCFEEGREDEIRENLKPVKGSMLIGHQDRFQDINMDQVKSQADCTNNLKEHLLPQPVKSRGNFYGM